MNMYAHVCFLCLLIWSSSLLFYPPIAPYLTELIFWFHFFNLLMAFLTVKAFPHLILIYLVFKKSTYLQTHLLVMLQSKYSV